MKVRERIMKYYETKEPTPEPALHHFRQTPP